MAWLHVLRVEPSLAQLDRRVASDMKAVGAVDDHRLRSRELADPLLDTLRITPGRAVRDVLLPGHVEPRPHVDELHRLAGTQHRPDLFDTNAGQVAILLLDEGTRRLHLLRILVPALDPRPIEVAHEGFH